MSRGKESKPHIGIFGRRNFGKSSLINTLAGQEIAIVSHQAGTTTDPVKKSMEITGIGPVVLVDTAGMDDTGELGLKRIKRSRAMMKQIDMALLVVNENAFDQAEEQLATDLESFNVPFLIVHNKNDRVSADHDFSMKLERRFGKPVIPFSSVTGLGREELVQALRRHMPPSAYESQSLLGDLLQYGNLVLLVAPIDTEAPEGRLILPQVQAIRDILDNDCVAVVVKERELDMLINTLKPEPALVVTDSQVFPTVDASIPTHIPLTSFSIILARQKGEFQKFLEGTPQISRLRNNDRILILESCTHHVACDDIGRVKIPRWLNNFSGKQLHYDVVSGLSSLPRPVTHYSLVVQCGGCVLTKKQVAGRLKQAIDAGVPVTNYGMAIAYIHGIYERAIAPFTDKKQEGLEYL